MFSAFYFFGGTADIFLSLMLWFILNDEKEMDIFVDGSRVYSVTNIIRTRDSGINSDCDFEADIDALPSSPASNRSSGVSKRMIDQFFTAVEGPDRDWE